MENQSAPGIPETIETGSVYYFEEERLSSGEPHYFIVLNRNPRTEDFLIFVCASSQVGKRKRIAHFLKFPDRTLVTVLPSEYPQFSKETIIDCNRVFEKTIQSLIKKETEGKLKSCKDLMPREIVGKLISGVLASDQISESVRKILLDIT